MVLWSADASSAYASPQNWFMEKAEEKVEKVLDSGAEKLAGKVSDALDKGWNWLLDKLLAVIFFVTKIFAIIAVGWIMSYMCDRDSRKMVRVLVILCVISVVVEKLVSLKA